MGWNDARHCSADVRYTPVDLFIYNRTWTIGRLHNQGGSYGNKETD